MTGTAATGRIVHLLQTHAVNPVVMLAHNLGLPPPGDALLETTGRRTGLPRHTPVCDGLTEDDVFWLVAQRGRDADWVRNIQADPRVRVKVRTRSGVRWRAGTAHIVDDDPRERRRLIGEGGPARRMCMAAAAVGDTDALTIRVDLDVGDAAGAGGAGAAADDR